MAEYRLSKIASVVSGNASIVEDFNITNIIFDSRKSFDSHNSLYIAVPGKRHNGHHYISTLYKKGVRAFIISDPKIDRRNFPEASFIIVGNTVEAFQELCVYHRKLHEAPVVGITGSNGKTVVKEWLSGCLSTKYKVTRSPKSYNSQIGVPLSVWLMDEGAEWGVFEAGISEPGEMEKLARVIAPDYGIITNIGEAHQENFNSFQEKLGEKLKLFKHAKKIFYCKDHELIHETITRSEIYSTKELIYWSAHDEGANLYVKEVQKSGLITVVYGGHEFNVKVPFGDRASKENIMHVISFLLYNKFSSEEVERVIEKLHPVAMRMEQLRGVNNCTLINDAYNSDINALNIALDYLNQQVNQNKVVILSDIQQSGLSREGLYSKVAELIKQAKVELFIGIGENLSAVANLFKNISSEFYPTTNEFIASLHRKKLINKNILIKGARGFYFERIVGFLAEKNHTTVLEINLNNLIDNLNYFRSKLKGQTKLMVMVKAFAYGSGNLEIAQLLQHEKINYLGVAFTDEGVQLRQEGINLPIMVMAPNKEDFQRIIEFELEPEIYSVSILRHFIECAEKLQVTKYPIQIKIDSGMHRLGFQKNDLEELKELISNTDSIRIKAVFSHLAASDEPGHDEFTYSQISLYNEMVQDLENTLGYKPITHILNSAGIERFPDAHFDMVRLGIGLHGISSCGKMLKPVSELKTHIVQVKNIEKGETIGYNRNFSVDEKMKIAILPIGYADGLDRRLGNSKGFVVINGQVAKFVGNICMDLSMVDITNINCSEGDEVTVFGDRPTITDIASTIETIPYEVLTNISPRVKRIYLKD